MSLLMDALRKAEQQKQEQAAQSPPSIAGTPSRLELEPILTPAPAESTAAPAPGKDRLPELPTRLEDLDEQFMAHAAKPAPKPPPAVQPRPAVPEPAPQPRVATTIPAPSPDAARIMFEAKQPAPANNRHFAIAVGLTSFVAAIGIGGYFWWQLQPKSSLVHVATPQPASQPAPITWPPPSAPAPIATSQVPAIPPAPTLPAEADMATTTPVKKRGEPQPQPPQSPQFPIRLATATQKINPALEQAYQAFNQGDIDQARAQWQKVLAADPRNADALHGMAAVAVRRQQSAEATEYYLRALEADPKDAQALSGLVSLKAPTDVSSTESRLKTLLAEQPDSPHLNFALGNLYARDARWADAQQAYFRAHSAEPANPDYLFNLAVSLDQLHQPRLAIQYYQRALAGTASQAAGFDAAQVTTRLKILQSGQAN